MTKIAGKMIYITGAASGMGLIAGKMLANRGANLVILDINPTDCALRDVESARLTPAQHVSHYALNISDRAMVIETVRAAVAEVGPPDILINMAGIGGVEELIEMKFEAFDRVIQINLYGTRHIVEAVLPRMIARGSGKIVLVGSLGGIVPVFGYTAYGASKFGVVGLAQCLRYELKPLGISVACFCPGEVLTPGLVEERKNLPPASAALTRIGGTMSAETAVRRLIEGIERNRFMIMPGWKVKTTYWMYRLTPTWLWNAITDAIVARARSHPT